MSSLNATAENTGARNVAIVALIIVASMIGLLFLATLGMAAMAYVG